MPASEATAYAACDRCWDIPLEVAKSAYAFEDSLSFEVWEDGRLVQARRCKDGAAFLKVCALLDGGEDPF